MQMMTLWKFPEVWSYLTWGLNTGSDRGEPWLSVNWTWPNWVLNWEQPSSAKKCRKDVNQHNEQMNESRDECNNKYKKQNKQTSTNLMHYEKLVIYPLWLFVKKTKPPREETLYKLYCLKIAVFIMRSLIMVIIYQKKNQSLVKEFRIMNVSH